MYLYVTRHGETEYNVLGRYCGSTDIPLNDKGFEQAKLGYDPEIWELGTPQEL